MDATSNRMNYFYNNIFDNNNGGHHQILDNGALNSWDLNGGGNWWSDHQEPDADGDGIVDVPYFINGTGAASDFYPLTEPRDAPFPPRNYTYNGTDADGDDNDGDGGGGDGALDGVVGGPLIVFIVLLLIALIVVMAVTRRVYGKEPPADEGSSLEEGKPPPSPEEPAPPAGRGGPGPPRQGPPPR